MIRQITRGDRVLDVTIRWEETGWLSFLVPARDLRRAPVEHAPEDEQRQMRGSSAECPHCHWGFAPSVIEQHIREKH